ncbi:MULTISPECIES: hypothetical protein [Bradyrhizobium]|jgi:hypothetical protein|uniref:Uncharacterized protein n=1 Tax=Bradyrhizobium elkanii TaxID=29448 RepID=A0A8I2C451_BRAEL|nr:MULTISPECIES: hypothetical protein [Bradyrhizobium]MBP1293543.1 hypothetical protein [Bradyrhizobium elkanii]MCP1925872.1 hypothetical protein [Bradyrhizobium elkanii]MCS3476636.1 hypothetical protein [Bradyrhizobium elkanii]MCW2114024.1 hypothetical protein [Bradyrhizobium elkanii]MCW2152804.1 hypothetical protein [Bradyrhizobium elkanii]
MKSPCLDLEAHLNAHAATFDSDRRAGFVNAWRNSFPAEEIPFGQNFLFGGTMFRLPKKLHGAPDHIEALEQTVEVEVMTTVRAVAVLGFGELGDQELKLRLSDNFGAEHLTQVILPNWLVPENARPTPQSWRATHLHYPDYELNHLRPCLFAVTAPFSSAVRPRSVTLHANPLAHVVAISLLAGASLHA